MMIDNVLKRLISRYLVQRIPRSFSKARHILRFNVQYPTLIPDVPKISPYYTSFLEWMEFPSYPTNPLRVGWLKSTSGKHRMCVSFPKHEKLVPCPVARFYRTRTDLFRCSSSCVTMSQNTYAINCGWASEIMRKPPKGWLKPYTSWDVPLNHGMFTTVFNWWFGFRNHLYHTWGDAHP